MPTQEYEKLSARELEAYYIRVKGYIEEGFRVDGLKEELVQISAAIKKVSLSEMKNKNKYLKEIEKFLKTIRL